MVAIVRYAYSRRSNPQVGAAFPCIKQHYEVWSCICVQTAVFSEACQTEQHKYVSLIHDSVSCTSSCLLWKTTDSFYFPLLKITRRSLPQVPSFYSTFSRLWIIVPRTAWLTQHCGKILCIHMVSLDTQLSAVDSLIESMMLVEEGDDEKPKDMFKVHHIPNPEFQRLFQVLKPSINSKIQLFCCVPLNLEPLRHSKVLGCLMNAGQFWAGHF